MQVFRRPQKQICIQFPNTVTISSAGFIIMTEKDAKSLASQLFSVITKEMQDEADYLRGNKK